MEINGWKIYYIATINFIVLYDTIFPAKSILSKVVIVDIVEDKSMWKNYVWQSLKKSI